MLSYFDVEIFRDHIRLLSDFTIIPFIYSKYEPKYEVRTHLRTLVPLLNPLKAVIVKEEPS